MAVRKSHESEGTQHLAATPRPHAAATSSPQASKGPSPPQAFFTLGSGPLPGPANPPLRAGIKGGRPEGWGAFFRCWVPFIKHLPCLLAPHEARIRTQSLHRRVLTLHPLGSLDIQGKHSMLDLQGELSFRGGAPHPYPRGMPHGYPQVTEKRFKG